MSIVIFYLRIINSSCLRSAAACASAPVRLCVQLQPPHRQQRRAPAACTGPPSPERRLRRGANCLSEGGDSQSSRSPLRYSRASQSGQIPCVTSALVRLPTYDSTVCQLPDWPQMRLHHAHMGSNPDSVWPSLRGRGGALLHPVHLGARPQAGQGRLPAPRARIGAARDWIALLLWKPFSADAVPPRWIRPRKRPERVSGRVAVTAFVNDWCPAQAIAVERARRAAAEFGDAVRFELVDTRERSILLEWGMSDAVFIDGRQVRYGPPPSYRKLRDAIARRARRLRPSAPPHST